jgi:hypothetical protein
MHAHAFLEPLLLYVVFPVWLLAGFADSLCHRAQRIEATAGWRESALHWLMLIELGIGVWAILLLELNAFVIALFAVVCILHELTLGVDLLYASSRRRVPAVEQWVHGVQQAIPWIVLLIISAMRPAQALAVVGLGEAPGDWAWTPRIAPVEPGYLSAFAAAAALLVGLPFTLEAWRAIRRRQQGLVARPVG